MIIAEKWKKDILNKWLVLDKENEKHCFQLVKLYPKLDWGGKKIADGAYYNAYHVVIKDGSLMSFRYVQDLPADIEVWGQCSYLKDSKLEMKIRKKMTKYLLKEHDKSNEGNARFVFTEVFGVGKGLERYGHWF